MNSDPPPTYSEVDHLPPASAANSNRAEDQVDAQLTEGDVMRIELYEEIPKFDREIIVREKVQIKKILMESADSQP